MRSIICATLILACSEPSMPDAGEEDAGRDTGVPDEDAGRDALADGEGDEQDRDDAPRVEARVGDDVLEVEDRLAAVGGFAAAESLIEDGDDERADGALQEADEEHRDGREGELPPMRLEVE